MSISVKEIGWVAGLLEGEGYFGLNNNSPRIQLAMTDLDIVEKARNLIGKNKIISLCQQENRMMRYTLTITGGIAIQWMMTMYPLMGQRRKARIKGLISFWKGNKLRLQMAHSMKKLGFSDEEINSRLDKFL